MKLNGDIPVEERRRDASSKPLRDADRNTLSIQLEFLDSCAFHCPGCFVKRKNSYTENDLDVLNNIAEQFATDNFEMNEIILGPTDLFGCKNAEEILSEPKFATLFNHFHALTFTSTLQSEHDHIERIVKLMKSNLPDSIYYEMFVVFDMSKYNQDKDQYMATLERNLALLVDANIIFAFNIHDQAFDQSDYDTISTMINERYNAHLKMVPSFFRSPNTSKKIDNLKITRDMINQSTNQANAASILNNMSDVNFGGYTYFVYVYKNGVLYSSPFIYDFIFDDASSLAIPTSNTHYNIEDVFNWEQENTTSQFNYSHQTKECSSCQYLPSCAGKKVLTFMENYGIVDCLLPKDTMNLHNNIKCRQ